MKEGGRRKEKGIRPEREVRAGIGSCRLGGNINWEVLEGGGKPGRGEGPGKRRSSRGGEGNCSGVLNHQGGRLPLGGKKER